MWLVWIFFINAFKVHMTDTIFVITLCEKTYKSVIQDFLYFCFTAVCWSYISVYFFFFFTTNRVKLCLMSYCWMPVIFVLINKILEISTLYTGGAAPSGALIILDITRKPNSIITSLFTKDYTNVIQIELFWQDASTIIPYFKNVFVIADVSTLFVNVTS